MICGTRFAAARLRFRGHIFFTLSLLGVFLSVPLARGQATYSGNGDFGTVNVGQTSAVQTLTFSFSSPTSLNTATPVQVLTTGITGLDFKNAGTGSCAGSTYSTCTVNVTFAPAAPGLRLGAIVLEDTTGNVLVTAYIHGVGQAPIAAFDTGNNQRTVGSGMSDPQAIVADANGNIYIADNGAGTVVKITPAGTQTVLASVLHADGIAVDGAGNIYVASGDPSVSTITRITPAGTQSTIGAGLQYAAGLAVDGNGNLYVANVVGNNVVEISPSGTQTVIDTDLGTPDGVAVDAAGNLFIADTTNGRVVKVTPDGTQTVLVTGLYYPESIAVDAAGNIYTSDYDNTVNEFSSTGALLRTLGKGWIGVAVDSSGNLYAVNGNAVTEFTRATPPTVSFLSSSVGITSSDSPETFTIENLGNASLSFPVPSSGSNPTVAPTDFSLDSSTTCQPLTSTSGAAASLSSGASCTYALDFTPTTTGTITGTLVLTDNSLNVAGATQTVNLDNQGTPAIIAATVTVDTVDTTYTGSPVPVTVTTSPSGLSVAITYTPLTGGASTTVDPSAPGIYVVTAVVTTPGYSGSGTGYLIINSPPPPPNATVTWPTPTPITVGTPLSATQLNATANTPGTFTYNPPAGTVLAVGTYTLTVTFQPTDTTDFAPSTTATVTLTVQSNAQNIAPLDFGTVGIGSTSSAQTVTFTFLNPVTLGATPVQVLTQGTSGLDFKNTGAGTCAAGSYAAGNSCTVTVSFAPVAAGGRAGAVVLQDGSGNALATAYVHGIGQGPQVAYAPGTQSVLPNTTQAIGVAADAAGDLYLNVDANGLPGSNPVIKVAPDGTQTTVATGLSSEGGIAVDGAGNVYVADTFNNRVMEFTPSGAAYTLGTGFNTPYGVAVDAASNVYVADTKNGQAVKIAPDGTQTTLITGLSYPEDVAVDSAGNIYVSDNAGLATQTSGQGIIYKIAPGGTQSIFAAGLLDPSFMATDAAGNLYVLGDTNTTLAVIAPTGVKSTLLTGLDFPSGIAVDSIGNLYIADAASSSTPGLIKIDRSTAPSLTFASTAVGSTSVDSPQTVTFVNIGNADLHLTPGGTTITSSFSFASPTCPIPTTTAGVLASGSSCAYPVDFTPETSGTISGSFSVADDALNGSATQTISLNGAGTGGTTTATVTLSNLNQTYTGSPLMVTATTNPAGLTVSITYNGGATPPTAAGSYTVVATVTSSGYTGSATGTFVIAKATPTITWATPAPVSAGTPLSATQLDATASVPGSFVYSPAAGTVPAVGNDTLNVIFTPSDTTDYNTAMASVILKVSQATLTISTLPTASSIAYGQTLASSTLSGGAATYNGSTVAGTFAWTTPATVPAAGTQSESITFTPADTTDYNTPAAVTISLTVNLANLTVTAANATKVYGTPNPSFTGTVTGAENGDAFTETFTTTATQSSNTGSYNIVPGVTGANLTDYSVSYNNGKLVIAQAASSVALSASATSIMPSQNLTLTATVIDTATGSIGTPTGTVNFYDGSALLGTGTLSNGTATLTVTTGMLAQGTHSLTAAYSGDANFIASTGSTTVVVTGALLDFTLTPPSSTNFTVIPGGVVTTNFTIAPLYGAYAGAVEFSIAGLPPGATAIFSPATIASTVSASETVTLAIRAPGPLAQNEKRDPRRPVAPISLGLLLMPFAVARRLRRSLAGRAAMLILLCVTALAGASFLSGCAAGDGFNVTPSKNYTVTVTATAGSISHSFQIGLNVQ